MRQVPNYLIIGDSRVAAHMCYYFDGLSINYRHWHRANGFSRLNILLTEATHALILITDSQIDTFIQHNSIAIHKHLTIVHFSGSLISDLAYSAHPLQSFAEKIPYSLDEYQQIPFILEIGSPPFHELLPGLANPHYAIRRSDKPFYHAMCVLANNATTLIWKKFYEEMLNRFGISASNLSPFLDRTFNNIKNTNGTAISGPIARRDTDTLKRNLDALKDDPFQNILEAIIKQSQHEE